ncbi:MAG: hypothetical protein O9256_01755 [Rhizobiaceae bacterium]|nr:hypothetical protein [Rhizobiaceae bacterium]MCZ8353062.1 hypothetical protein [Rhizobium sp.]
MPQYTEGQCIIRKIKRAKRALATSVAHIEQSDLEKPLGNVLLTLSKVGIGLYTPPTDERPQNPFIAMIFPPGLGLTYRHLNLALDQAMITKLHVAIASIVLVEEVKDHPFPMRSNLFDETLKALGLAVFAAAGVQH